MNLCAVRVFKFYERKHFMEVVQSAFVDMKRAEQIMFFISSSC